MNTYKLYTYDKSGELVSVHNIKVNEPRIQTVYTRALKVFGNVRIALTKEV